MDLEFMKDLMGDSYKEGITLDEVKEFMSGRKFADLSTGNYVDKGKYNNEINSLNNKLTDAQNQLNAKLTDEERNAQAQKDKDAEIENLKKLLSANKIAGNKNVVISEMASSRDILGIDVADKDFQAFVDNITVEDGNKSTTVAKYVAKIVKDSYEKGKKDATKDAMGAFGRSSGKGSSDGKDEIGAMGKRLAEQNKPKGEKFDYFK